MRLLKFIFSHSIFAAFCAVALCFQTTQLLPQTTHCTLFYLFVFFATLCSYNFHLLAGTVFHKGFLSVKNGARLDAVLLVLVSALVIVYTLWHMQPLLPWVIISMAGTLLYTLPLLPVPFVKKIRNIGFLKTFLLALTWTYVTVFLPLQQSNITCGMREYLFFAHRFCFMLQLCLMFDIRDVAVDRIKGLHSLATDISPRAVDILFYLLVFVFGLLTLLLFLFLPSIYLLLAFGMVQFAAIILYRTPGPYRTYFFYYFLVDGLMILSALCTALVRI